MNIMTLKEIPIILIIEHNDIERNSHNAQKFSFYRCDIAQ